MAGGRGRRRRGAGRGRAARGAGRDRRPLLGGRAVQLLRQHADADRPALHAQRLRPRAGLALGRDAARAHRAGGLPLRLHGPPRRGARAASCSAPAPASRTGSTTASSRPRCGPARSPAPRARRRSALRDLEAVQKALTSPGLMALFDLPFAPLFFAGIFVFHAWLGWLRRRRRRGARRARARATSAPPAAPSRRRAAPPSPPRSPAQQIRQEAETVQ